MPVRRIKHRSVEEPASKNPEPPPDSESENGKEIDADLQEQPVQLQAQDHNLQSSVGSIPPPEITKIANVRLSHSL